MANSDYLKDVILQQTVLNTAAIAHVYLSLHDGEPGVSGDSELQGRSYKRQEVSLERAGVGLATNAATIEFADLPRTRITDFGLWDAEADGHFLSGGPTLQPQEVLAGYSVRWRDGELILRFG